MYFYLFQHVFVLDHASIVLFPNKILLLLYKFNFTFLNETIRGEQVNGRNDSIHGHTKGVAYIMTDGTKIIYPLEYLSLERVWDTTVALFTKILTIKNCRKCKTKIKKSFTKILTIILSIKIVLTLCVNYPVLSVKF